MNLKRYSVFILIFVIFSLFLGVSFANDLNESEVSTMDVDIENNIQEINYNDSEDLSSSQNYENDEIVVNDWNDLQYYCSLKDKDYVLRLKENTNYYPTDCKDSNYQIKINNNVKIIGANGAYIGDSSSNPENIEYIAIIVPKNSKYGITLQGITFKWIYSSFLPEGIFLQISGTKNNLIKDCYFCDVESDMDHSNFINIDNGNTIFDNCTFVNCKSDFGCIGIYDSASFSSGKTVHVTVRNSYFENNYGKTAPGVINNCGILDVYNSTFYKNSAFWWAGAIHTHRFGITNIYNSYFRDNLAGWNGGALYTYSYLNIYNSSFIGNNCTTNNGGGVIGACKYISEPHIYIENSLFKDNENLCWELTTLSTTGTGRGGAISLMDEGSIEVLNSTFIKNSASIGPAICAIEAGSYGSPDVIIKGNKFINHTRRGDVLDVHVKDTLCDISDNYYYNNSIEFSSINLEVLSVGDESAKLKVTSVLKNPDNYDEDILDKTLYDVYVDGVYYNTVNSSVFDFDFGDLDICGVSVIPTIGNTRSNEVLLTSTREYIFVSKSKGNDLNNGLSRESPVNSILKAIQLAKNCKNILIMDGEFCECNLDINYDLTIKGENNSTFSGSISNNMFNVVNSNFTLKNINIKDLKGDSVNFIKQSSSGSLVLDRCLFSSNELTDIVDCNSLVMIDSKFINNLGSIKVSGNVEILNSIINNNMNAFIYKTSNSNLFITNSILLNNTAIVEGNKKNINLNTNWWGNILNNFDVAPNSDVDDWLCLNTNISNDILEFNQKSIVEYVFNLVKTDGTILEFNGRDLPSFDLNILALNGESSKNVVNFADKSNKIVFTLTNTDNGVLTASYNGISLPVTFKFIKSNPKITVNINDIKYGDDAVIEVILSNGLTGSLSLSLSNITKIQSINGSKVTFTINDLEAGEYTVFVNYSGDDKYNSSEINTKFRVIKFESNTVISVGAINVREDVYLNITVPDDATGNVTVIVNDINETIEINNAKVEYTITYVTRGDYFIRAIYNGNNKYLPSEANYSFEVDKLNSTINVSINNITYGEEALIEVRLNDNATGSVMVIIDGKSNSSQVKDGLSKIYLVGVDAGEDKEVIIKYSGDSTYSKKTYNTTFNVFKSQINFTVTAEDIKIGKDVIAYINVPMGVKGNFTFIWDGGEVIKVIPVTGEVTCIISDLSIGNYTVRAIYNGNNYFTTENSTSFSVSEYLSPQWSNVGGNTNTGKTEYEGDTNGNIKWSSLINSTVTGNMVIDSEGNVYVTTISGIYSYDVKGDLRWIFNSDTFEGDYSGICIGRDVIVAPKSGDTLYFINQNDGKMFGNSNIYQGSSLFEPIIDKNANIYIASEYQTQSDSYNLVMIPYKIWEKGGSPILIKLLSKPISAPILINDELVMVICENKIAVIDISTLKSVINKNGNYSSTRAVVGDGDVIYLFLNDNIIALNTDGSQSWKTKVSGGIGDCLVLDKERCLYSVNSLGNLYQYDLISGEESKFTDLLVDSGILIDNQGNVYFGSGESFYALDCDGNVLWKTILGSKVVESPIMDCNGVIYVTTSDNMIFALDYSSLKDAGLNVDARDIYSGDDLIINITIDEDTTGYITIEFDGEIFNCTANSFVKTISNLSKGNYTLKVYYSGDNKFKQDFKLTTVSVGKFRPNIAVYCEDIEFGDILNLNVVLNDDANGNVSVNIGGVEYNSILNNSQSVFSFPDLISGNYVINISYSGDGKYASGWFIKKVTVGVENISIGLDDVICYGVGKLTAIFKDSKGKTISNASVCINVGGHDYLLTTDLNGVVNLDNLQLGIGKHNVNVNFNGSDRYVSLVKSVSLTILSSIQVNGLVRGYNSGKDFQAVFVDCNGNKINSKTNVLVEGKSQMINIVDGILVLNDKLSVGLHTISVINPSTGESFNGVVKIVSRIGENKDLVMDYLDGSFYSVRIFGDDGNPVGAGVNVVVKINKKSYTIKTDSKGYAKLKITFTPGKYDIVVQYNGVKVKNIVNVKQVIKAKNIHKKKSKIYKYSVSLKKSNGKAIKNKKVILKIKGKKYQGKTNKKGIVIFKIKQSLKVGKYAMKITYAKSTVKRILTIK